MTSGYIAINIQHISLYSQLEILPLSEVSTTDFRRMEVDEGSLWVNSRYQLWKS